MHRSLRALFLLLLPAALISPPVPAQLPSAPAPSGSATSGRAGLNLNLNALASRQTANRRAAVAAIHTRAQAQARQAAVRQRIASLIGTLPTRTPLNPKTLGETQADGFLIRKVVFESQPGFPVDALLYLPSHPAKDHKHPAILITPGHYPESKAHDAGVASLFALNGFVVLSYDPIGQGERLQYPDQENPGASLATRATGEHGEASLQPMLIGDTFARYELWDAMRGVDFLSQLPEVDPHRIGALGCSGGGAITAMMGALDSRLAAIGVACYITSFDALLPAIGPQEGEQTIPNSVASGLDFPDWIEAAAPRPYAVIATYSDMFPFAGTRTSVIEARRFYSLFDPSSAGALPVGDAPAVPPTPSAPALNADTTNRIPPSARLQFITGPGTHGMLNPITSPILSFFLRNLQPAADADHPLLPAEYLDDGTPNPISKLPKDAFQVTPTGQVSTSYPHAATVFSLNWKLANSILAAHRTALTGSALAQAIRLTIGAEAKYGESKFPAELLALRSGPLALPPKDGLTLEGDLAIPITPGRHPACLFVVPASIHADNPIARANKAKFDALATAGNVVLAITPRPSPPGTEDMKSPLLSPFYLLSLRADTVGRTLLGMRVDDVMLATDYLVARDDVDRASISAQAAGHMGLVLLHAAVLDSRLRHIYVDHALTSYRSLVNAPLPIGAPEDIVPGALLHYDLPDLVRALGPRVRVTDQLQGTDDLSQQSTPLSTLIGRQP